MNELEMTNDFEFENSDVTEGAVDLPEDEESREDDFDDGHEGFVDLQDPDEDDEEDVGEDAEEDSEPEGAVQEPQKQTREENAAIRAARLRAEREGYAKKEAEVDKDILDSGILNPFTGKPFTSLAELRDYGKKAKRARLEERAKKEGKDISILEEEEANREYITKMRKEHEAKRIHSDDNFIASDVMDFVGKHPEFASPEKLSALENNESFRKFCGSRFGEEPLSELYDSYVDMIETAGANAVAKSTSRSARSTGAGGDGGDMLTPSERKALKEWNDAFPEMKMTPKEFKSRN